MTGDEDWFSVWERECKPYSDERYERLMKAMYGDEMTRIEELEATLRMLIIRIRTSGAVCLDEHFVGVLQAADDAEKLLNNKKETAI